MEESTILFAVTQTSKTLLEMKTRWRLVSINGIFVSATAHRQAGASPSLCSKGAAALNSATLKWLKAVLGPQKMKMPRSAVSWSQSHRDCTAQRLPQRSLCPVPGTGLQSVLCRIAYHSRITGFGLFMCSHRISSCWHLGVSFVCLFAFFNRFFSILTHHTAQRAQKAFCQPYPVFNSGFFFLFFSPLSLQSGNWTWNLGKNMTPMTLTVLLICQDLSWFLKALKRSYWQQREFLRIELMTLLEWVVLPSFSHRFLRQRLPYVWSWMSLLLLRRRLCFQGLHHVFLNFQRTKPGCFNEPNSIIPNPKVKH